MPQENIPQESSPTKDVLLILAHPELRHSKVNRYLVDAVFDLDRITMVNLYEQFPDFYIPAEEQRSLVTSHKHIVFQHPFYWYHCPALMKHWIDEVLSEGFAYGQGGNKLEGKTLWHVISTGGTKEAYSADGYNQYSMEEFLRPFEQTANLCKMKWKKPLLVQGTRVVTEPQLEQSAKDYRQQLEALKNGRA